MDVNKDKPSQATKHSVLQNENADVSGRYTMDGRVLQVARAVSKNEATKLEEEGVSRRLVRDKDKRRLYLLSEGTIPSDSPLYKKLSPSEIKMREESFKQRQTFIKKNPALHISLTRLAIRNIPRHVTSKDLKQLARQAVVGFATDVKKGVRQSLSKEEQQRSRDTMKELETLRKQKKAGIVRQAKVVFETRDGSKVTEKSGAGRSRGYGFIEYYTHRHALMGLRWLNCHMVEAPAKPAKSAPVEENKEDKKKRLIVEFAIENAQVVKRRTERELQQKSRTDGKTNLKPKSKDADNDKNKSDNAESKNKKRKRGKEEDKDEQDVEEENKLAKRNRIIQKKRMQRKSRRGKV
jgi:nucleolar protein 4